MPTITALTGGCLCGAVRYRCGPLLHPPTLCHCQSCRRACGAHLVGWLTVASVDLRYTAGRPAERESSRGRHRSFCAGCGSPLTYRSTERPGETDVTLGSLDTPSLAAPADHIWMEDAPAWDTPGDGLPQYSRGRPS